MRSLASGLDHSVQALIRFPADERGVCALAPGMAPWHFLQQDLKPGAALARFGRPPLIQSGGDSHPGPGTTKKGQQTSPKLHGFNAPRDAAREPSLLAVQLSPPLSAGEKQTKATLESIRPQWAESRDQRVSSTHGAKATKPVLGSPTLRWPGWPKIPLQSSLPTEFLHRADSQRANDATPSGNIS